MLMLISSGIQTLSSKTRGNEEDLVVRRATSCYVAKSYSYRISKAWNKLTQVIKTAVFLRTFKGTLLDHLQSYV